MGGRHWFGSSITQPNHWRLSFETPTEADAAEVVQTSFERAPRVLSKLEREAGIEPASLAWKARVLPLNYSRSGASPQAIAHRIEMQKNRVALVEEAGFEPA
jgi:hypothetical protein